MSESIAKHLELIQNIINRMNANSFQIKEWTVVLVSATLALFASTKNNHFILVGIFPSVMFWFLDAYYLRQERKFRGLYNDVAGISENPKQIKRFAMKPDLYVKGEYSYWNAFRSTTIGRFYLPIIIILGGLFLYLKFLG